MLRINFNKKDKKKTIKELKRRGRREKLSISSW